MSKGHLRQHLARRRKDACAVAVSFKIPDYASSFPGSAQKIRGSQPREFARRQLIWRHDFCRSQSESVIFPVIFPSNGKSRSYENQKKRTQTWRGTAAAA